MPGADPELTSQLQHFEAQTGVYAPSKHWKRLNEINLQWLESYGFERFKQTVNNNYFNWMLTPTSWLFRDALRSNRRAGRGFLGACLTALTRRLNNPIRAVTSDDHLPKQMSISTALLYKTYLILLDNIADHATRDIPELRGLSEPLVGSPLHILRGSRVVTQDLSNSRIEAAFIHQGLGKALPTIATVAELGAGYGRLIYALKRASIGKKHVIIDIPPALYIAQRYLREVFPEASVFPFRPFDRFDQVREEYDRSALCFLMPHQVEQLPEGSVDLFVNVSSLHEMTRRQIGHYHEVIARQARYFYTKQWTTWKNPDDGMAVSAMMYPTPERWTILDAGVPATNRYFVETLFQVR